METSADRRRTRGGKPEAAAGYEAVLAATNRLLAHHPLSQVSVEKIIAEAQVSRTAFYWHFNSKFDVLATLHRTVIDEYLAEVDEFVTLDAENPDQAIRTLIQTTIDTAIKYPSVVRGVRENWQTDETLGVQYLAFMERFSTAVGKEIDQQRALGVAPPGPDSQQLATALLWSAWELLYVASLDLKDLLQIDQILELLTTMWVGTIYGRPPEKPVT